MLRFRTAEVEIGSLRDTDNRSSSLASGTSSPTSTEWTPTSSPPATTEPGIQEEYGLTPDPKARIARLHRQLYLRSLAVTLVVFGGLLALLFLWPGWTVLGLVLLLALPFHREILAYYRKRIGRRGH